jgi:hypothetical protein
VRKVSEGPDGGRFVILGELAAGQAFVFERIGTEMTMREVCLALVANGISESDALKLLEEAVADFTDV